jgi:predicted transglutaminase-like cysteine proteinase
MVDTAVISISHILRKAARALVPPGVAVGIGFLVALLPSPFVENSATSPSRLSRIFGGDQTIMARKIPERKCPHCGLPVKATVLTKPATLQCKLCERVVDCFGLGDSGELEQPSWFLQGFIPGGTTKLTRGRAADATLVNVWFSLFRRIAYRRETGDIWQRPALTWQKKSGDCEDHALLLTDSLRSLGYEARAVHGTHKGQGHAWVVVNFKGKEYLLDQIGRSPARFPPLALLQLADYRPDYAYDEKNLYSPAKAGLVPTSYWNTTQWSRTPITDP